MIELLNYGFMQKGLIGGILIAIATGILSPYIVLRRLSLIGDGLAHLAFGGIAIGLLLNINPYLSALVVILLGSFLIKKLLDKDIYGEAVIALVLSLGIGIGVVIIGATKGFGVNIFSYLIGSILALRWFDIVLISIITVLIIVFVIFYNRELLLLTFQKDIAQFSSNKTKNADLIFTPLIALVTIASIQAVGILLVTALMVIPGLIALRLGTSFKQATTISVTASMITIILGIIGSFYLDIPPSGFIVLTLFLIYLIAVMVKK